MADARRMGKMELFAHFADKFEMKRTVGPRFIRRAEPSVGEGAEALRRVRPSRHLQAGGPEAEGARRPQPGDRRAHQDSGQDGREGPYREAAQGRRPSPQVVRASPQRPSVRLPPHRPVSRRRSGLSIACRPSSLAVGLRHARPSRLDPNIVAGTYDLVVIGSGMGGYVGPSVRRSSG